MFLFCSNIKKVSDEEVVDLLTKPTADGESRQIATLLVDEVKSQLVSIG